MKTLRLPIARTWDGLDIEQPDCALVEVTGLPTSLSIRVEAPLGEDPPPALPPGPMDRLWEHEVVELFIAGPGAGYTEIELGPWGHHLVLRLEGVRNVVERCLPLAWEARVRAGRWTGEAVLSRELLPPAPHRAGAFAIRRTRGERRHLAWMPVPGDRPDFHRLETFLAIELP